MSIVPLLYFDYFLQSAFHTVVFPYICLSGSFPFSEIPTRASAHSWFGFLFLARMQIHSQTHRVLPEDEAGVVVVGTGPVVGVRDRDPPAGWLGSGAMTLVHFVLVILLDRYIGIRSHCRL